MSVVTPVPVLAVPFLVLIAQDRFEFAVHFDVLVKTILLLLAVALLKVFALQFFVAGMVWIRVKFLRLLLPTYRYLLWGRIIPQNVIQDLFDS